MKRGVYIAQLLCPARHCVLASAEYCWEPSAVEDLGARLEEKFAALVARGILNPHCEICRSRDLQVETMRTRFETLEEALPALRLTEALQRQAADFWKAGRN